MTVIHNGCVVTVDLLFYCDYIFFLSLMCCSVCFIIILSLLCIIWKITNVNWYRHRWELIILLYILLYFKCLMKLLNFVLIMKSVSMQSIILINWWQLFKMTCNMLCKLFTLEACGKHENKNILMLLLFQ